MAGISCPVSIFTYLRGTQRHLAEPSSPGYIIATLSSLLSYPRSVHGKLQRCSGPAAVECEPLWACRDRVHMTMTNGATKTSALDDRDERCRRFCLERAENNLLQPLNEPPSLFVLQFVSVGTRTASDARNSEVVSRSPLKDGCHLSTGICPGAGRRANRAAKLGSRRVGNLAAGEIHPVVWLPSMLSEGQSMVSCPEPPLPLAPRESRGQMTGQ